MRLCEFVPLHWQLVWAIEHKYWLIFRSSGSLDMFLEAVHDGEDSAAAIWAFGSALL